MPPCEKLGISSWKTKISGHKTRKIGMQATDGSHGLALRRADFATLREALDYAARGETGVNFYNARGELYATATYAQLRRDAIALGRRLLGLGVEPGARVALVAETSPHFVRFFWACQYAGLVPVPLPATMHIGGHAGYVAQLRGLIENCGAAVAMAPAEWMSFLEEATADAKLTFVGTPEDFDGLAPASGDLPAITPESIAYIQYTSGSTRFRARAEIDPRGPVRLVAAVLPRYGAGRLYHHADGNPEIGGFPGHAGFRHAAAPVAGNDVGQPCDDHFRPSLRL
jgi:hypothetical protein